MVAISMVLPRHKNSRGSPGSPAAIREVSQVDTIGVIASLISCSDMIIYAIPWNLIFSKMWVDGGIQKLTAMFTLYSVVLNIFSAERTLFHYHLS